MAIILALITCDNNEPATTPIAIACFKAVKPNVSRWQQKTLELAPAWLDTAHPRSSILNGIQGNEHEIQNLVQR